MGSTGGMVIQAHQRFALGRDAGAGQVQQDRRLWLAADAADDATAALLAACDLLAATGERRGAREFLALAELAREARAVLPGAVKPAA